MDMKCYRQGELLFIKTNVPKGVDQSKMVKIKGDNCIREGEVSGHKHEVFGAELMEVINGNQWYEKGESKDKDGNIIPSSRNEHFTLPEGQMFMSADNTIEIKHPEHNTLKLEKGDYVIRIQREYEEGKDRLVND